MHLVLDRLVGVLAATHAAGSGELVLVPGTRADLAPTAGNPVLLTVGLAGAIDGYGRILKPEGVCVFEATGRTGDVLAVRVYAGSTDRLFPAGSVYYGFIHAVHIAELQAGTGGVYTNPTPMPAPLGGLAAGTTFDGVPVPTVLDGLLYPYQAPAFTAFDIAGIASPLECGQAIAGTRTFTWATSAPANVAADSISLVDVSGVVTLGTGLANSGSYSVAFGSPVTRTTPGTRAWRIAGRDTNDQPFTRDLSHEWRLRTYAGTAGAGTLTGPEVAALATGTLARTTPAGDYPLAAGGYKYLAWPAAWPPPVRFQDAATMLAVPMQSTLVDVTNSFGVTASYRVYRSVNVLGGAITIRVS